MSSRSVKENIKLTTQPWKDPKRAMFAASDPGDLSGKRAEWDARDAERAQQAEYEAYRQGILGGAGGPSGPSPDWMAAPQLMMPQMQPNQGLPMMAGLGGQQRPDFAQFMQGLRQNAPMYGYLPLMPQTVMPGQQGMQPMPLNPRLSPRDNPNWRVPMAEGKLPMQQPGYAPGPSGPFIHPPQPRPMDNPYQMDPRLGGVMGPRNYQVR